MTGMFFRRANLNGADCWLGRASRIRRKLNERPLWGERYAQLNGNKWA